MTKEQLKILKILEAREPGVYSMNFNREGNPRIKRNGEVLASGCAAVTICMRSLVGNSLDLVSRTNRYVPVGTYRRAA